MKNDKSKAIGRTIGRKILEVEPVFMFHDVPCEISPGQSLRFKMIFGIFQVRFLDIANQEGLSSSSFLDTEFVIRIWPHRTAIHS